MMDNIHYPCKGPTPNDCTSCDPGYYYSYTSNSCFKCDESCLTCTGAADYQCSKCAKGYFLDSGSFLPPYFNETKKRCQQCEYNCASCDDLYHCTSCSPGYYLTDPNTQAGAYFSGICSPCNGTGHEHCQQCLSDCNDATNECSQEPICTKCDDGFYIDENDSCQQCHESCATCNGPSDHHCTSCSPELTFDETNNVCSSSNQCIPGQHCEFISSDDEVKNYTTDLPLYENISIEEGNGGALKLINYGFIGSDTTFNNCSSLNGGGGAIFIYNKEHTSSDGSTLTYSVLLKHLTFTNCKAIYGASVYIYSNCPSGNVNIKDCTFRNNEILASESKNSELKGGSALYLTVKNSEIVKCKFKSNKGEGGSLKINDNFDLTPNGIRKLQKVPNYSEGSVLISKCQFEIEKNADCSLFLINGQRSTKIQVNDCTFTCNLIKGAHYIDVHSLTKEKPNLYINSCKFSTNEESAIINLRNQVFSSKKSFFSKYCSSKTFIFSLCPAIIIIIVTIYILKQRRSNKNQLISKELIEV